MDKSKKYNRIKIIVKITNLILNFALLIILVFTSLSRIIEQQIYLYTSSDYVAFIFFLIIIGTISSLISFPLDFYSTYIIEHRFNLSNQKLADWAIQNLKELVVSSIIIFPIAIVFYYLIKNYDSWWLILTLIMFVFSILLARIAPTFIFPIFYKFKELENEDLKTKLIQLCEKYGISFRGIYSFNMSKTTKKANAGFTGISKSKRIILSDTLIENFTDNEILTVFAHELGHYKKRHIAKNILIGFISTFLTFYLTANLYEMLLIKFNFSSPSQISALPLLFLILSVLSIVFMPVTNFISRKFEYEADEFAVKTTNDKESFVSALNKLSKINLADENPNPLIEFIFYSHPSIKKRIMKVSSI